MLKFIKLVEIHLPILVINDAKKNQIVYYLRLLLYEDFNGLLFNYYFISFFTNLNTFSDHQDRNTSVTANQNSSL